MREAERQRDRHTYSRMEIHRDSGRAGRREIDKDKTEIDKDRDTEKVRDRDTGGLGGGGAETEQGVFPVLIHSFEYGLPSQSLRPLSLSPAPPPWDVLP